METVKIGYAAMSNISFKGEVDTDIPRDEWDDMSQTDQDEIISQTLNDLVDTWIVD
jgi:hypothetical protein